MSKVQLIIYGPVIATKAQGESVRHDTTGVLRERGVDTERVIFAVDPGPLGIQPSLGGLLLGKLSDDDLEEAARTIYEIFDGKLSLTIFDRLHNPIIFKKARD